MSKFFDFSVRKSFWGCVLFYFSFFIIGALSSGVFAYLVAYMFGLGTGNFAEDFSGGITIGAKFSVVFCFALTAFVVYRKKLTLSWYLMALLAALLAIPLGLILGLVPATYLISKPHPDSLSNDGKPVQISGE